ncbi:MAG TPA: penicillin-binding protein 2 [Kofleriaceae bacterium]|nr:penicillin-binding protein 2 [Kofleriaceae bacterium]
MLSRGSASAGPALPELTRRLRAAIFVIAGALLLLVGRLWQLQVMRGDSYYQRTVSNVVKERFLPSIRGRIVDRKGVSLADNRPAFNLYVTPATYPVVAPELRRLLALTDEDADKIQDRVNAGAKHSAKSPVLALEDIGHDKAIVIQQAVQHLPGIEIKEEAYRYYPQGDLAAHVIGYMTQMTADELEHSAGQGYDTSELVGRYGIEAMFENYLRGKKGKERFAVDAQGRRIDDAMAAELIQGDRVTDPVAGFDVMLTIDSRLQKVAEKALAPYAAGAVAVIDVKTGRILALVSKPSFDPNTMTGHVTKAELDLLNRDPRKPFIDKSLRATYPPGSTFKFVTTFAALEDGQASEDEKITCKGYYQPTNQDCDAEHGTLDLLGAIQKSCNVYFWNLAQRIGLDRLSDVAQEYGLGRPTGLGLNGDAAGRVPTRAWYEKRPGGKYMFGYAINAATGQGDVEVTVLQMAMAYTAIANGGTLYFPQIVERVLDGDGKTVIDYQPRVAAIMKTPPEIVDVWKRGLYKVVNELGGTANPYATSSVVTIAGKTGTAEVKSKTRRERIEERTMEGWHPTNAHAWFAGFAPYEDPEIAIVVFVEHGGSGGKVAGPIAKQIVEAYFTKIKESK